MLKYAQMVDCISLRERSGRVLRRRCIALAAMLAGVDHKGGWTRTVALNFGVTFD